MKKFHYKKVLGKIVKKNYYQKQHYKKILIRGGMAVPHSQYLSSLKVLLAVYTFNLQFMVLFNHLVLGYMNIAL